MDRAGAQLNLLGGIVDQQLAGFDPRGQLGIEVEDAVEMEDVGHDVVGEGGEAVEIAKPSGAAATDVGGGELGALEERDRALSICRDVGEGLLAGEEAGEDGGRATGRVDRGREAPVVVGQEMLSNIAQGGGELRHQRVSRVLP